MQDMEINDFIVVSKRKKEARSLLHCRLLVARLHQKCEASFSCFDDEFTRSFAMTSAFFDRVFWYMN